MRNQSYWKIEAPGTVLFCGVVLLATVSGMARAATTPATPAAQTAVSTVDQSVVTISRDGSRREFKRQIRVFSKHAPKAAPASSPAKPKRAASTTPIVGQTGPGRSKPNLVPGYPNAVINSQSFGSTPVGGTSSTITLSYPYPAGVTEQNLTFAAGLNGFFGEATCNYPNPCTAPLAFQPNYPGLTTNAVISKDQNGNVIYETLLYATGTSPQLGFDLGDLRVSTGLTNQPDSVAVGPDGNYYITDASQNAVYKYTTSSGSSGQLDISGLGTPGGIAVDGAGTLYIADKTHNAILAYNEGFGTPTTLTTSTLSNPTGVGVDGTGAVYVADTGNNRVIKIDNQGTETTLASGIAPPTSLAVDSLGNVFYVDDQNGGEVTELPVAGGTAISIATGLGALNDIAVDAGERIYISTPNGDTLISPDGTQVEYGGGSNYGMAVDQAGNVITTQPGGSGLAITNRSASNFILTTQVGTTTTGGDTISNTGNMPLTLSNLAISGTVFTKDSSSVCVNGLVVQPGQKCDFSVDFSPPAAQSYQETYTATSNSLNDTTSTNGTTLYGYGTGVATAESLNINPNPVLTGQTVELIGTVSRTGTGVSGVTNGSTSFYDGTTLLGTVSQANGAEYAMYFTSALSAGTHSITSKYNGDTINAASTSAAQTLLVTAGNGSATTLQSGSESRQGQSVYFQMQVSASPAQSPVPTGTVTLTNTSASPAAVLGTITIDGNGAASLYYSKLPVGNAALVATYSGDANYAPSTSATDNFTVLARQATVTALTVSPTSVAYQTPITLTAMVGAGDSNLGGGQVFFCDTTLAVACNLSSNLGIAQISMETASATLKLAPGTIGTHSFTANFVQIAGIQSSVSSPQTVTVTGKYPSATSFTTTGSGGNYSATGTVVSTGSNTVAPTGMVSFLDTSNSNSVLGSVGLGAGAVGFSAATPASGANSTGEGSYGQAAGDFNGDGFQDLVVGNYEENTVSILLGKGDGTFQPEVKYNVGSEPERVLVADLNGDGNLDLVVANTGSSTISVLLGNGDGTFQMQVTYPCASPVGLGVMDVNGDGLPDVVAGDYYANTMSVLLGYGDGTLQTAVTYPTGSTPQTIAEGDFNGDGFVDVAVGNNGDNTVGIFLGNGDGTFQQMVTYAVGNGPQGVQTGDFNGDGKLDLAVTNHEDGTVSVLLGNGDGTFQTQVTYPVGGQPVGLVIADFNGDGKQDIAVGNTAQSSLTESILLGNGDGTFQTQLTYPTGNFPYGESSADFNGDGFPDVGVSNFSDGTSIVLLSQVTETATGTRNLTIGGSSDSTHAVEASYPGDANVSASVSPTTNLTGGGTVAAAQSATTLAITPAAPTAGQSVTFTVAVAGTEQVTPVPTGIVTLTNTAVTPAAVLGTVTLNGTGTGSFSTTALLAGTYTVVASYSGDTSYQASASTAQTLTIAKSAQTITFGTLGNQTYGAAPFALTATASSGLAVTYSLTGPATVTGSTVTITGVGQVVVTAAQLGNATYAAATSVSQSFTVAKAVLTATASNVSRTFGVANPALTYTTAGFVNGDTSAVIGGTATLATTATTTSPVGTYPITFATQALTATNYSFTYLPGTLTVQGGAAQTITFPAIPNHTVGDAPFTLTATASSGLAVSYAVTSGPATVAGSLVTLTGAGTVTIQATQAGNATYAAATPVSQTFTVSPAAAPTLSGLSPVGAVAGSAAQTVTLTGTNFTSTDQVKVNSAAVATTFVSATTLTAVIPASLLTEAGTLPVTVTDTASGDSTTVASFLVEVAPVVVFTGPSTAASGDQPMVTFQLKQPYAVPINCLLTLTFAPATTTGIDDPAVQFSSGGRTINVTLPAGSTTTPDVQFQAGTVAGTVTVTLTITADDVNVTPASVTPVVVTLPTVVPQISAAKVGSTTTAVTVTVTGFSNTREVKSAIFHFTPTPGNTISNPDVTIDVTSIFASWYNTPASNAYGSTFTYAQPFNLNADATTIMGVTVTLVNAVGNSVVTTATQ
ncbi:beta strand repeat-containing protein [Granulicella aggregans]|uniref:beta strand repeat-containing protein n=1 Tax=Granulicella aggregans TaxID=474949 RepID=UPI0021DFD526|nr:FG-GAP-like repeat-containing protein [Granulicella aggregans]